MGDSTVSFVVANKSIARGVGEDDKAGMSSVSADRNVMINYRKHQHNNTPSPDAVGDTYCSISNGKAENHTYYSSGWSGRESSFGLFAPQYKVFMSLIGNDKVLSLSDLKNAKKIAKDLNVKVDDSRMQSEGKVTFTFVNGDELDIDFETDAEQKAAQLNEAGKNTQNAINKHMNSQVVKQHVQEKVKAEEPKPWWKFW